MLEEKIEASLDEAKLGALLGQIVGDTAALASTSMVMIGNRLGLYTTIALSGPVTPAELAERAGISPNYLHYWLINQAASGYLAYDPATGKFEITPEQAQVLAYRESPLFMADLFDYTPALLNTARRIAEVIPAGIGLSWADQEPAMQEGQCNFSRISIETELTDVWIPALDGVRAKLEEGATVADVGCGYGVSTVTMARAFPNSRFYGFDSHQGSIDEARNRAHTAGVENRVTFEALSATRYPPRHYDFIAFIDSFHDMGNLAEVSRHACESLNTGGTVMLVEPSAGEAVEENFNVVGRLSSAVALLVCLPTALDQGGPVLGPLATDRQIQERVSAGGFGRFRKVHATPFNRIFEVKP